MQTTDPIVVVVCILQQPMVIEPQARFRMLERSVQAQYLIH